MSWLFQATFTSPARPQERPRLLRRLGHETVLSEDCPSGIVQHAASAVSQCNVVESG